MVSVARSVSRFLDKSHTFLTLQSRQLENLAPIPDTMLECMDQKLEGEEKRQFIGFMRKMCKSPEDRQDSEGVYWDEWLLADLIESGDVGREN